jgi:hypothetical protein
VSDDRKTDASPESTWGATAEAKAAWERKHGSAARRAAEKANKDDEKDEQK